VGRDYANFCGGGDAALYQITLITCCCCRRSGLRIGNIYGTGSGTIWLDGVECFGGENTLGDCWHGGWGNTELCTHDHDVTITCATNFTNTIGKLKQGDRSAVAETLRDTLKLC